MRAVIRLLVFAAIPAVLLGQWSGYANGPQHTAISGVAAQPLNHIHWQTPVDQSPMMTGGELLIHYGSISVTAGNTVLLPVKTTAMTCATAPCFEIMAFNGATGASVYTLTSDYTLPPGYDWTPSYEPTLSLGTRLYYAGAGGSIYYRDLPNSPTNSLGQPGATGQYIFYGKSLYTPANQSALNSAIQISTPITADRSGNLYFGFIATTSNVPGAPAVSGLAKVGPTGIGTWVSASSLAGNDPNVSQVARNCGPALSNDQKTVYVAVSGGGTFDNNGYLVSLSAATLAPVANAQLFDPQSGARATVSSDSSATPMIGPDGDVYYGVLESPCCVVHNDRGWMLHFNSTLKTLKTPGSFGWDNTPSLVASALVPSYTGTSGYLILTKYNNYNGIGTGNGVNEIGVLDPNATMPDEYWNPSGPYPQATVMKEVLTVTTSVGGNPSSEWCVNTTAIDPYTKAAIINSENGKVYRWDFTTNSLLQTLTLTGGIGEAYTPTVIGPDGTVFAVNDAILFAVGN